MSSFENSSNRNAEPFYVSLNSSAKQTIVFLHGLFCSHLEFALVAPYLPEYHLLLVDMPGHSRSKAIYPFSPSTAAGNIAQVIRNRAHGRCAHVVGLSAGGFVGTQLTIQYPELVSSLWISGATPLQGFSRWLVAHPRILYLIVASLVKWMPNWMYRLMCRWVGMQPHDEVRTEIQGNFNDYSLEMFRTVYESIADMRLEETTRALGKTGVRTLVVAAELQDDIPTAKEMAKRLRHEGSVESKAAIAQKATHGWDLQFPDLFAKSIRAWIEETSQPEGMKEVD